MQGDHRPANCRFRLQDEGKPHPRSSCQHCGRSVVSGLGTKCQYDIDALGGEVSRPAPKPDPRKAQVELVAHLNMLAVAPNIVGEAVAVTARLSVDEIQRLQRVVDIAEQMLVRRATLMTTKSSGRGTITMRFDDAHQMDGFVENLTALKKIISEAQAK